MRHETAYFEMIRDRLNDAMTPLNGMEPRDHEALNALLAISIVNQALLETFMDKDHQRVEALLRHLRRFAHEARLPIYIWKDWSDFIKKEEESKPRRRSLLAAIRDGIVAARKSWDDGRPNWGVM